VPYPSTILIPQYTPDIDALYWNRTDSNFIQLGADSTNSTASGDFSFFPVYPFGGRILNTAASSSTKAHDKYDNSRFSYLGRSFGVGASVGLAGDILNIPNVESYTYFETGYQTNVSCITNSTSAFYIAPLNETRYFYLPIDYVAVVILPNSNVSKLMTPFYTGSNTVNLTLPKDTTAYPLIGFASESPLLAVGAVSGNGRNMLGLASSGAILDQYPKYQFFNQTECEVTFTPRTFQVTVNTTGLLIQVSDVGEADELLVDPTTAKFGAGMGVLAQRSLIQILLLSLINTSLYTSVVGDGTQIPLFILLNHTCIKHNRVSRFHNSNNRD
jgi:hypothetical protein